jgi:CHAT domain-containing protein
LQRLAFTRQEALEIARVVPQAGLLHLTGFDANREQVTNSRLREFRVVHFATHALISDVRPELSGIVLSRFNRSGASRDGHLRLHEIYNLDLPADLVVLSACDSALGSIMKGEGIIGLTRGFTYAGASSVLASLWKVHDEATASLMAEFYKAMFREGMTPASALSVARIRIARQRRWAHPYYWAGFVLHGEWR